MKGIYVLTNRVTGRHYVGSAVDVERRTRHHLYLLRTGRHYSAALQNAWNTHGDSFDIRCVEVVEDANFLTAREQFWIWRLNAYGHGYNGTPQAGSQGGYRHTPEARAKMSAAKRGKPSTRRGAKCTPDQIEHMRRTRAGRKPTQAIAAAARALRGRKRPPEVVAKVTASLRAYHARRRAQRVES